MENIIHENKNSLKLKVKRFIIVIYHKRINWNKGDFFHKINCNVRFDLFNF